MEEGSADCNPSSEDIADTAWVPKVDMEFTTDEAAYQFYNDYARIVGFSVRKAWINRRASGTIISRTYVCHKEGYQGNRKDESEVKKPRENERTGCLAHLTIKLARNGGYRISEFHPMHNHELVLSTKAHTLRSHRVAKRPRIINGEGASQKVDLEYLVRQAGGYRQVNFVSLEEAAKRGWAPKVGMEFENDDRAYHFYYDYARKVGFDVRKAWINRRPSGVIISRTYTCYKEGYYGNKKDENQVQQHRWRPSDRTGCPAKMTIKLSSNGRYRVTEFQPMHNHEFVTARTAHTLKSHRSSKKNQSSGMELINEPRLGNRVSNTHLSQISPSVQDKSLSFQDNLSEKLTTCSLNPGDLGAALQYMQGRQADDPSFYYSIQIDNNDQFSNIFWTDGNCMADFHFFGDVVCFDTTYEMSSYGRPLALFYGVNHHKQIIIFGTSLMYSETKESFKWIFETFTTAMSGKQPRVILTDRNPEIHNAITTVWKDARHRICSWHIYHYAAKRLPKIFQGSRTFASDFSRCVYDYEEEEEFIVEWVKMLEKYDLKDNKLLKQLFDERQSWAMPYQRELFCADIKSAQQTDCLHSMLKVHLKPEHDLLQFLELYGKAFSEKREALLFTNINSTESNSILTSSRMLKQAARVYTPEVFDMFQKELEMSMDCLVYSSDVLDTIYEYKVKSEESPSEHLVRFNTLDSSAVCSCKKFEFVGIQCRHVLKVLDIINIKELPPQYFLKRWRKDAKVGFSREKHVPSIYLTSNKARRFSSLCHIFNIIAAKAAETADGYRYIESQSDQLLNSITQIAQARPTEGPQFG